VGSRAREPKPARRRESQRTSGCVAEWEEHSTQPSVTANNPKSDRESMDFTDKLLIRRDAASEIRVGRRTERMMIRVTTVAREELASTEITQGGD